MGGARTLVRRSRGAVDLDIEISEVIFVGNGADTRNTANARLGYQDPANTQHGLGIYILRLGHQTFRLFNDTLRQRHPVILVGMVTGK